MAKVKVYLTTKIELLDKQFNEFVELQAQGKVPSAPNVPASSSFLVATPPGPAELVQQVD